MKLYMEPIGRDGNPIETTLKPEQTRLTTLRANVTPQSRGYRRCKMYQRLFQRMSVADPDNKLPVVAVRIKTEDGDLVETVVRGFWGKATRLEH